MSVRSLRFHFFAASFMALAFVLPFGVHAQELRAISGDAVIVTAGKTVQSSMYLGGAQIQRLLPGISPLKAIEFLPGVSFQTADPWGNNEQNMALVVHGFGTQQLGYTLDDVPLGDQQYGNYNGLSVSRGISSENVGAVALYSGAASLGVASTSNLGGAIGISSADPAAAQRIAIHQTGGSYGATRTFLRYDTGAMGADSAYFSLLHHDARAWDFRGHQKGNQANAKFVKEDDTGRLTIFANWQEKDEPNEDPVAYGNQQAPGSNYFPYTRPFLYPDLAAGLAYLNASGAPPAIYGNNFSNYFSASQRQDVLTYAKYDWNAASDIVWSNQIYYHYNDGRGVVAGPVNQAGLPLLFSVYYPGQNLVSVFGGTGYVTRTTEYGINRFGGISTLRWQLGDHQIEAGLWYERNASSTARRWYPFSAANTDLTPYSVPTNPAITQYNVSMATDVVQIHLQDQWQVSADVKLQAGLKASLQTASNTVLTQQRVFTLPVGSITSNDWFLPQVGAVWDVTDTDQIFVNAQKNMRQFIPFAAGSSFYGSSPWSLGSQAAFDSFKATARPETSWTYEAGLRSRRNVDFGPVTAIEGQINYYHVDFSDRLFNVATANFINPNPSILVNVGGVATEGVDMAMTLNFGDKIQFYNAVSYNDPRYQDNYDSAGPTGANVTVPIAGRAVPLMPDWLEKFIISFTDGGFEAQVNGAYTGRRYATYLNDMSVPGSFVMGFGASYSFTDIPAVHDAKLSVNVTNLNDEKGISTIVPTNASGGYQAFPLAPRMFFVTLAVGL